MKIVTRKRIGWFKKTPEGTRELVLDPSVGELEYKDPVELQDRETELQALLRVSKEITETNNRKIAVKKSIELVDGQTFYISLQQIEQ